MRLTAPRLAVAAALLLNLATLIALITLYKTMYPLPRGNSNDFWAAAVQVNLHATDSFALAARVDGDRVYYIPATLYYNRVHWLPLDEAIRDFPAVLTELKKRAADPNNMNDEAVGFRRWSSLRLSQRNGLNGLILCIEDAKVVRCIRNESADPGIAANPNEYDVQLATQIARSRRYYLNFVFEFLFFTALIWFVFWPTIHSLSLFRTLLHLIVAPLFLLAPSWFGYCAMCIHDESPGGGILYPYLIWFLDRSCSGTNQVWEMDFFRTFPQLLEPINQSSCRFTDIIRYLVAAPFPVYIAGPFQAGMIGLALCITFLFVRLILRAVRLKLARRPGFEILPALTPSNTTAESAPPAPPPHSPTPSTPPE